MRYPTGIPLYNYQQWMMFLYVLVEYLRSAMILYFLGCVHKLDTVELCISQVCVSTCQVFSIWQRVFRNDTLRFGKGCLLRLPVVDQSPKGCKHQQFGRSRSPNSSKQPKNFFWPLTPSQILHSYHVLSCFLYLGWFWVSILGETGFWTHKHCRLIDSDSISY